MSDCLLEWMSYREFGRRGDLPESLLAGESAWWMLRDLSALGHAEVEPDGKWRITPPVLAEIQNDEHDSHHAILCGARTFKVMERLETACLRVGAKLETCTQEKRPSTVAISGSSQSDLTATAAEAGVPIQHDAALTLLACLPVIRDWPRTECPMVAGRVGEVKRFSRSRLTWVPSNLEEAVQARRGLFRIRRDWDWISLIKLGPDTQAQIEVNAGRMATADRAKVIRWDSASHELRLPQVLYPPSLITRALVLCSGVLPDRDRQTRELVFHNVPVRITRMVVAITGLRLA